MINGNYNNFINTTDNCSIVFANSLGNNPTIIKSNQVCSNNVNYVVNNALSKQSNSCGGNSFIFSSTYTYDNVDFNIGSSINNSPQFINNTTIVDPSRMTIVGSIVFNNCTFLSAPNGKRSITANLGSGLGVVFNNCTFYLTGTINNIIHIYLGDYATFKNCIFYQQGGSFVFPDNGTGEGRMVTFKYTALVSVQRCVFYCNMISGNPTGTFTWLCATSNITNYTPTIVTFKNNIFRINLNSSDSMNFYAMDFRGPGMQAYCNNNNVTIIDNGTTNGYIAGVSQECDSATSSWKNVLTLTGGMFNINSTSPNAILSLIHLSGNSTDTNHLTFVNNAGISKSINLIYNRKEQPFNPNTSSYFVFG